MTGPNASSTTACPAGVRRAAMDRVPEGRRAGAKAMAAGGQVAGRREIVPPAPGVRVSAGLVPRAPADRAVIFVVTTADRVAMTVVKRRCRCRNCPSH